MSEYLHLLCSQCGTRNRVPPARLKEDPRCGKCRAELLSGRPIDLPGALWHRFLAGNELPLVVYFWASWCGHCRNFHTVFAEAAAAFRWQAHFVRIETEEQPELARQYAIKGLPTQIVFNRGREIARQAGAAPLPVFSQWLEKHL
ncbi:MAG TPA: redoxin domain-containing protein [Proteobacteria bacterium]|nr:redoxin domain-containing protein [Pseudomonadota bacterium]